jgi:hypothetical protein
MISGGMTMFSNSMLTSPSVFGQKVRALPPWLSHLERHVISALDPTLLTVGQLAWMESDLLILAIRPLLLASGLEEKEVKKLTEAAQRDLYYPLVHIENRLHVVHAIKSA